MSWVVKSRRGIWLPQVGWWLDAQDGKERSFVSHAHSDHAARHREVVCTPATARLVEARLGGRRVLTTLRYGEVLRTAPDAEVVLHPAGHILGSAQMQITTGHGSLLYTGDFKLKAGLTTGPAAAPRADVLIMETTFGLPRYVMPPAGEVHAAIVAFCRQALAENVTPVLYAYSLGKSQELAALLGQAGLPVMLHAHAARIARIYAAEGVALPEIKEFDPIWYRGHVVVTPQQSDILDWINPKRTAVVTGWALDASTRYRYGCDEAFPLSDHADFPELLAFVERVQPRLVYTVHGYAREFATTLRARGVEAWALGRGNQLELSL
ncbi:MAG TPA: MBL fold metallo-hydrolase RNA specificity domain-containing protein [Candidatus Didemnitutus sp.]|jgi:Cft2 family RNA processing exonuclease